MNLAAGVMWPVEKITTTVTTVTIVTTVTTVTTATTVTTVTTVTTPYYYYCIIKSNLSSSTSHLQTSLEHFLN